MILIKEIGLKGETKYKYGLFKCDCGKEFETQISRVKGGFTKSCGCLKNKKSSDRIKQRNITDKQSKILSALEMVKIQLDEKVLNNSAILKNENFFIVETEHIVDVEFEDNNKIKLNDETFKYINTLIATEYLNEYNGVNNW